MVLAVPITLQTPQLAQNTSSSWSHSSAVTRPSISSETRRQPSSVATGVPRNRAQLLGPAVSVIAGFPALAAPINWAGTVLSQPASKTTPSMGLQRIISSTSIAIRLRNSIVLGATSCSCSEIVGNTTAVPPAAVTPRRTDSASPAKPWLHGFSSLQLEHTPMTGRRRTASRLRPPARKNARIGQPVHGSANASPVKGFDVPATSARLVTLGLRLTVHVADWPTPRDDHRPFPRSARIRLYGQAPPPHHQRPAPVAADKLRSSCGCCGQVPFVSPNLGWLRPSRPSCSGVSTALPVEVINVHGEQNGSVNQEVTLSRSNVAPVSPLAKDRAGVIECCINCKHGDHSPHLQRTYIASGVDSDRGFGPHSRPKLQRQALDAFIASTSHAVSQRQLLGSGDLNGPHTPPGRSADPGVGKTRHHDKHSNAMAAAAAGSTVKPLQQRLTQPRGSGVRGR